jgi:exonuclease III
LYYDNAVVSVGADTTPPTVLDIVDDKSGGPILDTDTVVYTVTFSEGMNATTVEVGDFENAGSPAATIDSVVATGNPAVFEVSVTPGSGTGTLQLQIKSGAVIEDSTGNALVTTPLITDTEVIAVSPELPLTLEISRNGPAFDFSWNSRADKLYDLLSSTDLSTPPSTWPVYDDGVTLYENIVPSGLTTVLTAVPSADPRRFFVLREKDIADLEDRILRVLSWNIWSADANYAKINEVIQTTGADVIGFQELGNVASVVSSLETATGEDWHSLGMIISRFPIIDSSGGGALIQITPEQTTWVFNVHFAPYPYQPYDLRDGTLAQNEAAVVAAAESARGGQADSLVTAITNSGAMAAGIPVFVTGDFNEPSHLDWTQEAADATARPYDLKVEYPASKKMANLGLADTFRTVWPDEVARPGYTWTPGSPPPSVGANEVHDRIDFVYYSGTGVTAIDAVTVGIDDTNPNTDIAITAYPSDHRAVLGTFVLPEASE